MVYEKRVAFAVQVVKDLQNSTGEAIHLLRAMIGEVGLNMEEEESAICSLYNSLQVRGRIFLLFLLCCELKTGLPLDFFLEL